MQAGAMRTGAHHDLVTTLGLAVITDVWPGRSMLNDHGDSMFDDIYPDARRRHEGSVVGAANRSGEGGSVEKKGSTGGEGLGSSKPNSGRSSRCCSCSSAMGLPARPRNSARWY